MRPADLFGNRHGPDDTGYCPCWQCPKFDGIEWWTPDPRYQQRPISLRERQRLAGLAPRMPHLFRPQ
jgi:hypothetical protein